MSDYWAKADLFHEEELDDAIDAQERRSAETHRKHRASASREQCPCGACYREREGVIRRLL